MLEVVGSAASMTQLWKTMLTIKTNPKQTQLTRSHVTFKVEDYINFSLGLNLLGLATEGPVVRGNGTDQQDLYQFKAKITRHKHKRVTKMELQFLKLSGSLSPFIGNLSFLRELNLEENSFYNEIPQEIGRLRRLLSSRENETDQQALLQFKAKITPDQINVMETWNSSIHFCQWHVLHAVASNRRVTKRSYIVLGGRLHFVKFKTSKLNDCLDFISSKHLHCGRIDSHNWNSEAPANENAVWNAVGRDIKPLRKRYLEAIVPPFVAALRRWRRLLYQVHKAAETFQY
ncbi:hypothetical protein F3Y22_tig00110951pilonHSYRG00031 [Hibiscus syriacus]|uniref:Leucine-rich repeat-containing N-terminal plant-type domain-containing protein n=1 Tax=Hibiscus syriacus TaxID=106335 RepID=A0A6A2ZBN3_HIBSY|nr:hypothetical protein F3Y22_tig00110951pilonHSYRG00031 [Hibiscus syriacus]